MEITSLGHIIIIASWSLFIEHSGAQLYVYEISLYLIGIYNCIQMNVKRKVFDKDIIVNIFRTSHLQVMFYVIYRRYYIKIMRYNCHDSH